MGKQAWSLALAELIYYIPSTIPVLFLLWRHRRHFLGWLFLFVFASLQIVGSGMTISAGENGTPSATAITLTSVGMSPLMLAIAGVIHEWVDLSGILKSANKRKWAWVAVVAYHMAVAGAIAIYALGSSNASDPASDPAAVESGRTLSKAGVLLLLVLWFALHGTLGLVAKTLRPEVPCQGLFWSIVVSMVLLGVRLIYATVATFNNREGVYNPITGSIALRVILEFLPGALILPALVFGGVMSLNKAAQQVQYRQVHQGDMPLVPHGVRS